MKNVSLLASMGSLFCWGILSITAKAQTSRLEEIHAKEASIQQMTTSIFSLERVRDQRLMPNKELKRSLDKINDDIKKWIDGYQEVVNFVKTDDLDLLMQQTSKLLRIQSVEANRLINELNGLKELMKTVEQELYSSSKIPAAAGLESYKAAIEERRSRVQRMLKILDKRVDGLRDMMNRFQTSFDLEFFASRYKAALLADAVPSHQEKLALYTEYLKAEIFLAEIMADLKSRESEIIELMTALMAQTLKPKMKMFKESCDGSLKQAEVLGLSKAQLGRVHNEISKMCKDTVDAYQATIAGYSAHELAHYMHQQKLQNNWSSCKNPSGAVRCDVLYWLRNMDRAAIEKFDNDQRRELENSWKIFESSREQG